ncbi:MAG: 50S ribosomal protein L4 [Candidatus Aenigmarchaeota archaeon]|nr:50S ribosomal protein L4 [Candidatus Aenigmarchaeota archaeon]
MKANVIDLNGKAVEKIDLPKVFDEPIRQDLVLRAVLATQNNKRQVYSPNYMAGKRTSAHYHGRRRIYQSMMNREMARLPRIHPSGRTVPFLAMDARFVPQAVKGRRAHPPKTEKIWNQKINKKEKRKAIDSAIAATAVKEIVEKRHRISELKELPIIVENKLQELKKTKDVIDFLKKIGLDKELVRISERKVRSGKGKARGRKYKTKVGPLFVVTNDKDLGKAVKNILGCDTCKVGNLSAEYLAPGAMMGRLTIFTKDAVEKL